MEESTNFKVLIVDQSRFIKSTLQNMLQDHSTEVRCLSDSSEALLCAIRWHPNVIITSVQVGEISGFDFCMVLKLMPDYTGIPFIIISSDEMDDVQRKAADVGADYYVPKDQHVVAGVKEAIKKICGDVVDEREVTVTQTHESKREPGNVLIVDDSSVMRSIIRNMLRSMGIEAISEAINGADALKVLEETHIGLVLTDWNMPVMTGIELIESIRAKPEYDNLPIVMVTTEGGHNEVKKASDAGATDHLCKPFSMDNIRNMTDSFSDNIIA